MRTPVFRQASVVPIRASNTVNAMIRARVVPVWPSIRSPKTFNMSAMGAPLAPADG